MEAYYYRCCAIALARNILNAILSCAIEIEFHDEYTPGRNTAALAPRSCVCDDLHFFLHRRLKRRQRERHSRNNNTNKV